MEDDGGVVFAPSQLGQYRIIQEIAEGTFGKVKMAIHVVTGQKVAMKYLSKEVIQATRTKTRVQREVDYMRMLRHPHIIKLYEVISTPRDIIIVLEFAGGELFNYIVQHGRMPESRARRFFQQLMSGIDHAHRCKVVHRDLKPENVLLDDDLNVKIADFGLSNTIKDGDFLSTSCGSPNYAAPEVIRGGRYAGPEIDVWSCGVILYVMLCGRLPFEDDDVQTLFSKISQGIYQIPNWLSPDARNLLNGMLAVDSVKRLTVAEVLHHPFVRQDLPKYLSPLPPPPGPVLGTLTSLVSPPQLDFEYIDGLGRIEDSVVEELANRLDDVDKEDIYECLRRVDGVQGNAVKVAYILLRDKYRQGQKMEEYEAQERDAQLAAMDPRNPMSPNAVSPGGKDIDKNPFDSEFSGADEDDYDEDEETELDFSTPELPADSHTNNFAVLHSSLPEKQPQPAQHHLASYANAKRSFPTLKEKKQHRTKWHFGIRSRSPPMEVMLEIYRTLKQLKMEWREKSDLGGLGGVMGGSHRSSERAKLERNREWDGQGRVDLKAASSVYFVETRVRVQNVVVLMNLQLYQVDSINYLVDFHHKKSYRASTEPGAGRFEMADPKEILTDSESIKSGFNIDDPEAEDEVVSPFVFMDVACKLIIELAGGSEQ